MAFGINMNILLKWQLVYYQRVAHLIVSVIKIWTHLILTFLYFNVMCLSVCLCLCVGWFTTSHGRCWPFPGVVSVLPFVFLVHMLFGGSCTGGLCQFSCGVNVIVANFVGEWIMLCWKWILSA